MDNQEYLNQISATSRPVGIKKKRLGGGFFSSKFFILGVVFVVALILMAIVGAVLGSGKGAKKEKIYALSAHIAYDMQVINEYQDLVKSSDLRSDSASLNNVLSATNRDLEAFFEETYNNSNPEKVLGESKMNELELARDDLLSELFNAKINGTLDIIYARKLTYEISLLMSEEEQVYDNAKDETLLNTLSTSYNSLKNLYDKINGFSET
ncbi:hypothetical protein IKG49_00660 [Candidatus Saccharibacteria bacterium]|nr:hypothetical protein [Candidatus Saccharibacteria bacterium]